ncbi:DUF1127 domain-containing protein [Paracoccus xiamenensis]|uniref:DUF1127 domain-containing protein n=1 Tax=Paracoccus xiamenensis TaxID=2714901 RepID=UPI00140D77C3|nr:DUF1127 domain-containing protein [Paracoccus xiamenensis]NHF72172.1 DUF1127 domain-containing protein [Paracoccus xiamenensis]
MTTMTLTHAPVETNGFFARVTETVRSWLVRMDTRAQLERLTDRELRDIGLTRADIDAVVNHRA